MHLKLFPGIFSGKKTDIKKRDFELEVFRKAGREQFIKLKRLGISIPVMTF